MPAKLRFDASVKTSPYAVRRRRVRRRQALWPETVWKALVKTVMESWATKDFKYIRRRNGCEDLCDEALEIIRKANRALTHA